MPLPASFHFTQASLQDFTDCQRRFYLRHIRKLAWPALISEPASENENFIQLGIEFHRRVQQYFLGIPSDLLELNMEDNDLSLYWDNFLKIITTIPEINNPENRHFPELSLHMPFANYHIMAKFDLLVITPDSRFFIYDWKTTRNRPSRSLLQSRWQTQLYPFILVNTEPEIYAQEPIPYDSITLIYWYAALPTQMELFKFNSNHYFQTRDTLLDLIHTIEKLTDAKDDSSFRLTDEEKYCLYCNYRSLCNRGTHAGGTGETDIEIEDPSEPFIFDFDQIAETEF